MPRKPVQFEFKDPDTARGTLKTLRCTNKISDDFVNTPVEAIDACAAEFEVPEPARELAQFLGQGHRDLLIVLLEPTEIWSTQTPEEVFQESWTLKKVDGELRDASCGQRTWRNTCMVISRPMMILILDTMIITIMANMVSSHSSMNIVAIVNRGFFVNLSLD